MSDRGVDDVRCGGSGELVERVSPPGVDPRDPAFETREYECPGCQDCRNRALLSDRSSMEDALRHAVESGQGFYSAAETEQASRWALAEVDRLRAALESLVRDVEREVHECAGELGGDKDLCSTCRELLKPWTVRAREALNGGTDGR